MHFTETLAQSQHPRKLHIGTSRCRSVYSSLQLPSQPSRLQNGSCSDGWKRCGGEATQPGCSLGPPHDSNLPQGWIPTWCRPVCHRSDMHHCCCPLHGWQSIAESIPSTKILAWCQCTVLEHVRQIGPAVPHLFKFAACVLHLFLSLTHAAPSAIGG